MRQLALADDMWLLCHDDRNGQLLLHPRTAGLAVGAALLLELVDDDLIGVWDRKVRPTRRPQVPRDHVTRTVLAAVRAEAEPLLLRTWLEYLAVDAVAGVAQRLEWQHVVRREETRRLLRTVTAWTPLDFNQAAWPGARLSTFFHEGHPLGYIKRPLDRHDEILTGLVWATGLDSHLLLYANTPHARDRIAATTAALDPPTVRELVLTVHALSGATATTRT